MKTVLKFSNEKESELPEDFEDIRFSEEFVRYILSEYSKEGDVIFDPFSGFGTTIKIAEEMGRVGYGTEYDEKKVEFARKNLKNPDNLILGDALKISEYDLPNFDLCLTSPLYMRESDDNPFGTKRTEDTEYKQYLKDIKNVYSQVKEKLNKRGKFLIEVSNTRNNSVVTTLAWDIAKTVSEVLFFEGEIILEWEEGYGYDYDHSYLLVFRK